MKSEKKHNMIGYLFIKKKIILENKVIACPTILSQFNLNLFKEWIWIYGTEQNKLTIDCFSQNSQCKQTREIEAIAVYNWIQYFIFK